MTATSTTTAADIRSWTKPGTDETRRYINNWAELAGIEVDYYKSGNVSSVSIADYDGNVSNAKGSLTAAGKVWLDDADNLHLDYHKPGSLLSEDEKRARLVTALATDGIAAR